MSLLKTVCIVLYIAAYYVEADKYTDENRPYEFGFTIEGEQHRHEKKDENGIIMGEFGFITADGVYHVTVYATDENGNFKILSMKNIRVKPYPTAPTQNLRQGHSLELPSSPQTKTTIETNNEAQHIKQNSGPAKTCSHCSVPTTTTSSPKFFNEESVNTNNQQKENQYNTQIRSKGNLFSHEHNSQQKENQYNTQIQSNGNLFSHEHNSQQKENQYNTQIQSNGNLLSHEQNSQQNLRLNNIPQNINNNQNSNQKPVTVINQGTTEQQYSQNLLNNKQPSREINTPYISSYSQSFDVPQNNPPSSSVEPANFQNYPQSFENNPKIVNAGQKHSQGSSPLSSNTGNLYRQTQEQPGLAEAGKTSEGDAFNSDKYHPKKYVKDENLPTTSNAKYGQEYTVPQNSININRQPKSFNEILDSVNPENEYNIGSTQSDISNIPKKPILLAAQMQIVDKNTNIYQKNPGEKDGLPDGLTGDDMKHLLYTFNYTLGFHGHHEEGYTNGAKYGYYFVTGRNGIRTRVDYIADETGFHPKISQEVLDVLSDEVPKPETEKDDKYGLKGYEFKWLFYPVNSS